MGKRKGKKTFDGGRSILHIKNSSGGFCKVQKTGRIGKTVNISMAIQRDANIWKDGVRMLRTVRFIKN